MMIPKRCLALAIPLLGVAALAPGCAAVAMDTPMQTRALVQAEREIFGDVEAQEFSKRMQVRLPAKLAVADVTRQGDEQDHRRLVQAVNGLAEDSETYVDVVSLEIPRGITAEQLRRDASGHQADLQLSILRRETVRAGTNGWGFLKLLIVPMFFVPTEENDVQLTVRAVVRDVRNGLIYTTFDDRCELRVTSSVVAENDDVRRTQDELFDRCVTRMREVLGRKLAALERASR